jgi:hypothetical protein
MTRSADDGAPVYSYYIAGAVAACSVDPRLADVGFDNLSISALCSEGFLDCALISGEW